MTGRYEPQRFHKNPRPYWYSRDCYGVAAMREDSPTHWAPIPEPPEVDKP